MTHETDEELSALIDGELPGEAAARARAHAASCAECAARMEKLSAASLMFKRSGARAAPAGLGGRVKAAVKPSRARVRLVRGAMLAAGFAAAFLISGAVLKRFIPSLFNNIQQMITGAASSAGSGK
jgi:anti-sigma factor RsiW